MRFFFHLLDAYFTKSTEGNLNTIDSIPWLRDIQVPEGIFTSARQSKKGNSSAANASSPASASAPAAGPSNSKAEPQPEDDSARIAGAKRGRGREGPSVQRTYAPFPVGESRRHHQRPVVPAPPPPPPPLPPGAMAPPPPPHAGHPMHVDVPSTVQTVRLRPIDTTPTATMRGSPHPPGIASSPVSAGGVHVSTMGMYNMHLGEGEDPAFHPHQHQHHQQPQHFHQGAYMFGDQASAQMQRMHEQQQLQQQFGHFSRDFDRPQAFFPSAFDPFDPSFAASPHSPHHLVQGSPAHSGHSSLSPALSDFRAASEYGGGGGSSGSGSSRGASVSSGSGGSGRGQSLTRMGTWSPRPGSSAGLGADAFAFGHYGLGVKTEFSELGNALGTQSAQALPGLAEVVGEASGAAAAAAAAQGEDDEDLSGYLPMPPIPVETETDARPCSAGDDLRRGHPPAPAPPAAAAAQQQPQPVQQHGVVALTAFDTALYDDLADDGGEFYVALPHESGFASAGGACPRPRIRGAPRSPARQVCSPRARARAASRPRSRWPCRPCPRSRRCPPCPPCRASPRRSRSPARPSRPRAPAARSRRCTSSSGTTPTAASRWTTGRSGCSAPALCPSRARGCPRSSRTGCERAVSALGSALDIVSPLGMLDLCLNYLCIGFSLTCISFAGLCVGNLLFYCSFSPYCQVTFGICIFWDTAVKNAHLTARIYLSSLRSELNAADYGIVASIISKRLITSCLLSAVMRTIIPSYHPLKNLFPVGEQLAAAFDWATITDSKAAVD